MFLKEKKVLRESTARNIGTGIVYDNLSPSLYTSSHSIRFNIFVSLFRRSRIVRFYLPTFVIFALAVQHEDANTRYYNLLRIFSCDIE